MSQHARYDTIQEAEIQRATMMTEKISKTQIDRLGDRLRQGNITEADLRLLDEYRRTFTDAYEVVIHYPKNVRAWSRQVGRQNQPRPSLISCGEKAFA